MIKSVMSHAKNTFDIKATPFLDSWKSTVLAQAKLLGISIETPTSIDFNALSRRVEDRLLEPESVIKQSNHLVRTNNNPNAVLTAQEQLYLKKAKLYNIELNEDEWCEVSDLRMFDAVDAWEKQLKEAIVLGVNWKISDYDPEGLERAIEEKEETCNIEAREERRRANAYYYSTRGV